MLRGLILILALSVVVSCNYREDKLRSEVVPVSPVADPQKKAPEGTDPKSPYIPVPKVKWIDQLMARSFKPKCVICHSKEHPSMDVDLSSYDAMMKTEPPIIVAGAPLESTLYLNIQSGRMPLGKARLSDAEINAVYEWIKSGAKNE